MRRRSLSILLAGAVIALGVACLVYVPSIWTDSDSGGTGISPSPNRHAMEDRGAESGVVGVEGKATHPAGGLRVEGGDLATCGVRAIVAEERSGNPIEDAIVSFYVAQGLLARSRTATNGVAAAPVQETSAVVGVFASKTNYSVSSVGVDEEDASTWRVEMARAKTLSGQVRLQSGEPAASSVVCYWPVSRKRIRSLEELLSAAHSEVAVGAVATDERGEFCIPRASLGSHLEIVAVGSGEVSHPKRILAPGEEPELLIKTSPLFAVAIQFTDERGGRPLADPRLVTAGISTPVSAGGLEAVVLTHRSLIFALLGVDLASSRVNGVTYDHLGSYVGEPGHESGAVMECYGRVPGYEPWKASVVAHPVSEDFQVNRVSLKSSGTEFGILDVDIGGAIPRAAFEMGLGELDELLSIGLREVDGRRRLFYPIRAPVEEIVSIRGVPFGSYYVYLEERRTKWRSFTEWPECSIVRVGEAPARVRLDSSGLPSVLIECVDLNGDEYYGELSVRLEFGSGSSRYVRFEDAPYYIVGVPEGEVDIYLRFAKGRLWNDFTNLIGQVRPIPGELIRMSVVLPFE